MSFTVPFLRRAAVPAAAALAAAGLWAVPAAAEPAGRAPLAAEPTPVSVEALPTVQVDKGASGRDGAVVWSQAVVGNTVYVGGDFTVARPAGAKRGEAEVARTFLLAYDITTGNLVTSFDHTLNGQVRGVAASPDGSRVYITGDFTEVDGQSRIRLAAFNTADGSLVAGFSPVLGAAGLAVSATSSTVYVGGNFAKVGQTSGTLTDRAHLAAFAADDGAVRDFRADADAPVGALAVTAAGDRLAVGGRFTSLSGTSARGLGSVDPTTGASQSFPVNTLIGNSGNSSAITSLYADATGIYGTGYHYGGNGNLEGTFRADPGSGALLWVADCYGDTYSVAQAGGVVYDASHHHDCASTPGGFPEISPRRYHHGGAYTIEATGTDSGSRGYGWSYQGQPAPTMLEWYPEFMTGYYTGAGQGPWSVAGNSQYVSYGGEFQAVNSKKIQQGLVRFAAPGGAGAVQAEDVDATYTSVTDGVVTAAVSTGWGKDGETLTYRLYRGPADAAGLTPADATLIASQDGKKVAGATVTLTDSAARPGTTMSYLVTVTDSEGSTVPTGDALASAWQQVKVAGATPRNAEPVASFTATADGLRVAVDGTASTDDSAVASYSWSFGDQTAAVAGATASHTYASAGTYQVTLTATDDEGAVGTTIQEVTATAPGGRGQVEPAPPGGGQGQGATPAGAPVAWYESTVNGLQVSLDGSGSCDCDGEIVSYQWEFGDGTTGDGVTVTHSYRRPGTYRAVLIVTDDKGLVSAVYSDITLRR